MRIEATFGLRARRERPLVSIVTVGEALALARKFGWGNAKVETLKTQLSELVVVDLAQGDILSRYAIISAHCMSAGVALSDNDRWIAATVAATGA